MAAPEKERVARLETRAVEAETALQQLKHYIDLIRRKSGQWKTVAMQSTEDYNSLTLVPSAYGTCYALITADPDVGPTGVS